MPDVSGVTVVTMLVCFFTFAHKAAGVSSARHSLRPLHRGSEASDITRAKKRGEIDDAYLDVFARSETTKQSILACLLLHGLLRGACHRARVRATRWLAMARFDDSADKSPNNGADIRRSGRYINPARHVRAFGVGLGIANDGIDTIERRP